GQILACAILGDHAFESGFLYGIEEREALLFNVVAECQTGDGGKDLPKDLLAPDQGQATKGVPVQVADVKHFIDQMPGRAAAPVVLQRFKAWMAFVVEDHDFAIQNCLVAELRQSRGHGRVAPGEWQAVPGVKPDMTVIQLRHDAVTVPFDLEYPAHT